MSFNNEIFLLLYQQTPNKRLSARLAVKRRVLEEKNGNTSKLLNNTGNTSIHVVNGFKSSSKINESLVVCTSYNEFAVSGMKSLVN